MDRILHPQEVMIQGFITNPEEKKKFFYECWVTKESYLKNLGCGLTVRPNEFAINEDKLETEKNELERIRCLSNSFFMKKYSPESIAL